MITVTMAEKLKIHAEIESENRRKLNEWKEKNSDVQDAEQSAS